MTFHEFDLLAVLLIIWGLNLFRKTPKNFKLHSGSTNAMGMLDESNAKVHNVTLSDRQSKLAGISLIILGGLILKFYRGDIILTLS